MAIGQTSLTASVTDKAGQRINSAPQQIEVKLFLFTHGGTSPAPLHVRAGDIWLSRDRLGVLGVAQEATWRGHVKLYPSIL